jgi:putative ABC transport system ATP-binding protein
MAELVRLEKIVKDYQMGGENLRVLKGVDLVIHEGEFVALMGPSGSGKSTLMNILGCLDRPTFGRYFLGEVDVSSMTDDELSEVRCNYLGFIFQSYNLIPQYTVVENIELPLIYQGVTISAQTKARCEALARMVGLGERLDHRPLQLSGGQQQRVAIARSLVNNPQVILGDEPTGNLDSKTSVEIMQTLSSLNRAGKTIIMVTHENDIAEWAKRIVRLRDGVIESDAINPHPRTH